MIRDDGAESRERERRLVTRVLDKWRALEEPGVIPRLVDIDPRAFGDMWRHCYLLDVGNGATDPRLIEIGAELARESGGIQPGGPVSALPAASLVGHAVRYWNLVVERQIPVSMGGEFFDQIGRRVLYRSIIVPLSDGARQIAYLLGAANCRPVTAD